MTKQRAKQAMDERIEIVAIVTLEQARAAVLDQVFASIPLPEYPDAPESIKDSDTDSAITFEL